MIGNYVFGPDCWIKWMGGKMKEGINRMRDL